MSDREITVEVPEFKFDVEDYIMLQSTKWRIVDMQYSLKEGDWVYIAQRKDTLECRRLAYRIAEEDGQCV